MPARSAFLINYPETVQPPVALTTCRVVYQNLTFDLFDCAVDLDNYLIVIAGGFNTEVAANATLVI
jgi:hypothetical protein